VTQGVGFVQTASQIMFFMANQMMIDCQSVSLLGGGDSDHVACT
jgi:hypothetical protein